MGGIGRLRVLMLLDNPFVADQRVRNEAACLAAAGHDVTLLAVRGNGLPAAETVDGVKVRRSIDPSVFDVKRPGAARRLARDIAAEPFDVLHCHDHWMLDLGARVKKLRPEARLVYDSHELFRHWPLNLSPEAGLALRLKSRAVRAFCVWRERRNASAVDHVVTVNDSLARELQQGFALRKPPVVVRNIPPGDTGVEPDYCIRAAFGIPPERRILACIGTRLHRHTLNIEQVMEELKDRTDVALVLIAADHRDLEAYSASRRHANVYFHPFVPPARVRSVLAGCDVGLVPTWNRRDLSYWYALDNKLFDYVAAGIPVLATRQPEYLRLVEGHSVGVCVDPDDPGAYSRGLTAILDAYPEWRARVAAARRELTWEKEQEGLLGLYAELEAATRA